MDNKGVNELLDRYFAGNCTPEEKALVEHAYLLQDEPYSKEISDERYDEIKAAVYYNLNLPSVESKRKHILWPRVLRITGVAAAVALVVLGVWFYTNEVAFSGKDSGNDVVYKNDVKPGRNTATITLANGMVINLSEAKTGVVIGDDKLAYNDGSMVANLSPSGREGVPREGSNNNNPLSPQWGSLPGGGRSKVQMLTASTPRGGTYQIVLPDGTKVWLNADSKISFPSRFSGKERKVLLSGEAYFEVVKAFVNNRSLPKGISPGGREVKKRMPFIVESAGQKVEVLGTHFNINAYKEEGSVKTTLLEGSVRVLSLGAKDVQGAKDVLGERSIVLKPDQQSVLIGNAIQVKEVDTESIVDWKNNDFVFNGIDFKTAMRKIARWYNVEIVYEGQLPVDIDPGGWISRENNLSIVLKRIESSGQVHFKIEGRRVYVTR